MQSTTNAPPRAAQPSRRKPSCTGLFGILTIILTAAGCQEAITDGSPYGGEPVPSVADPALARDLEAIHGRGVLRVLTHYNATSYFIHKGGQAGFDYELVQLYARRHDLALEVEAVPPDADLVSLLNAGRGDVICASLVARPEVEKWITPTRPTNFVRQVILLSEDSPRSADTASLTGATVTVPTGGTSRGPLLEFRERNRLRFFVTTGRPSADPRELIAMVAEGELEALLVDDTVAKAAMAHIEGVKFGPIVGPRQPTVWYVRRNCPELLADLNGYLAEQLRVGEDGAIRRSRDYGVVYDRYFQDKEAITVFNAPDDRPDLSGAFSPYDDLIRARAEAAGFDWRLIAALIYQESRFYPRARSRADARGLMQVLPRFAGAQADSLFAPRANLTAGLRLMRATWLSYAYLDSLDRLRFTLAEYHAGNGHLTDARRISMDMGRNPNEWEGSLVVALPRLMERSWYSRSRYGYYGGGETVDYVEEIINRYRNYMQLVPRAPAPEPAAPPSARSENDRAVAVLPELPLESE